MILSYDSILGIPTVQGSSNDTNSNSYMGFSLGIPALLFLVLIIVLFIVLFSSLGKQGENVVNGGDSSTKLLTILMGGILIVVVILNGLQYFYNINLTARLDNLFTEIILSTPFTFSISRHKLSHVVKLSNWKKLESVIAIAIT